jgi:hypothetical protein
MGAIDLDPCSNSHTNPNVPARVLYTKEDDGLSKIWQGNVYLNPPFAIQKIGKDGQPMVNAKTGKPIMTPVLHFWIEKLVASYRVGTVRKAIVLVPSRTDTTWFRSLQDFPVCFIGGRPKFVGSANSAPFPSAIFALGIATDQFAKHFSKIGKIYLLLN